MRIESPPPLLAGCGQLAMGKTSCSSDHTSLPSGQCRSLPELPDTHPPKYSKISERGRICANFAEHSPNLRDLYHKPALCQKIGNLRPPAAGGALDHCRATTVTRPALLLLYGCPGLLKLVAKVLHHLLQLKLVLCLRWLCPAPRGALLTLMYPCRQACPHQCCPAAGHIMVPS